MKNLQCLLQHKLFIEPDSFEYVEEKKKRKTYRQNGRELSHVENAI
ncbi:hypothetical protein [uncultured Clostridium sp.]|nr:hypothetical protein [uncultured Clostridium sp.]